MASKDKKTWTEKLRKSKGLPRVEKIPKRMQKRLGKGTMVIPSPQEVNSIMKKVGPGKVITINRIREKLAKKHKATIACPMTTGIFSWIAAHAAEEERIRGKVNITPYWRTLREGGVINDKYPGGIQKQAELLKNEGHHIIEKRKRWVVEEWNKGPLK